MTFDKHKTKQHVKGLLPADEKAAALYFNLLCFYHDGLDRQSMMIHTCNTLGCFLNKSKRSKSSYYYNSADRLVSVGLIKKDERNELTLVVHPQMLTGKSAEGEVQQGAVDELISGVVMQKLLHVKQEELSNRIEPAEYCKVIKRLADCMGFAVELKIIEQTIQAQLNQNIRSGVNVK